MAVYTNPNIEIKFENGSYGIYARSFLDVGSLVLIEHVFYGTLEEAHALLHLDDVLRKTLHPRTYTDSDPETNAKKITMNAFQFDNELVIGSGISKFNHRCKPNAYLTLVDHIDNNKFYGVYTTAKVAPGDEITLDYFNGHSEFHDKIIKQHGITCSCTPESLKHARIRASIELDLATRFRERQKEFINLQVDQYLSKHEKEIDAFKKKIRKFIQNNIKIVF